MKVVTSVSGRVPRERRAEFESAFRNAKIGGLPPGLETSFLLRSTDDSGLYTIQSNWSTQEALEAMRASGKPKAVALFEAVGVSPTVAIQEMAESIP